MAEFVRVCDKYTNTAMYINIGRVASFQWAPDGKSLYVNMDVVGNDFYTMKKAEGEALLRGLGLNAEVKYG